MKLQNVINAATESLLPFTDDGEIHVGLSNWEDDYTDEGRHFRNYRRTADTDLLAVIEHATRRGENLELVITIQLGSVNSFTTEKEEAFAERDRRQAAVLLQKEYEQKKAELDKELAARINSLGA